MMLNLPASKRSCLKDIFENNVAKLRPVSKAVFVNFTSLGHRMSMTNLTSKLITMVSNLRKHRFRISVNDYIDGGKCGHMAHSN